MDSTTLTVDNHPVTVEISTHGAGDLVFYTLADDYSGGTILVQPARLGMHPLHGVLVTLGGYGGSVDVGDWAVSGSVTCTGVVMQPRTMRRSRRDPIAEVRAGDPATADYLAELVSAVAAHYVDSYRGRGLR